MVATVVLSCYIGSSLDEITFTNYCFFHVVLFSRTFNRFILKTPAKTHHFLVLKSIFMVFPHCIINIIGAISLVSLYHGYRNTNNKRLTFPRCNISAYFKPVKSNIYQCYMILCLKTIIHELLPY